MLGKFYLFILLVRFIPRGRLDYLEKALHSSMSTGPPIVVCGTSSFMFIKRQFLKVEIFGICETKCFYLHFTVSAVVLSL